MNRYNNLKIRCISVLLAVLTLWSTTGFAYSLHFCQNTFQGLTVEKSAFCCNVTHSCKSQAEKSKYEKGNQDSCEETCCKNKDFVKKAATDVLNVNLTSTKANNHSWAKISFSTTNSCQSPYQKEEVKFFLYSPPLIFYSFSIAYQIFRI